METALTQPTKKPRISLSAYEIAVSVELAKRAAKKKNILSWNKIVFPHKFYLPFCSFHEYLVSIRHELLSGTEGPRNHAKTIKGCFAIPLFQALEEPESFQHYLNVQATGKKADAVNISIRHEIELNPIIRLIYGDMIGEAKWTDSTFVLKNGVCFSAVGAGQSIRGIHSDNKRPDYIIVDDLYDREHINNVEATEKMNEWFWSDLYPARDKAWPAVVKVQGTAINNYDLLERMKKMNNVKFKSFKAIQDNGTILWPELNSREQLEQERISMGSVIFAREMQNERRDETTAIVKRSWLYPVDGAPSWEYDPDQLFSELKKGATSFLQAVILTCDPSIGEKVMDDFSGMALMYQVREKDALGNQGDRWYIQDLLEGHYSLNERIAMLNLMALNVPFAKVSECRIESIAGFKDFTAEVKRRTNLPVKEIDCVKDKISNLESKSHFFENGKVKLNKNIKPELKDKITYQLTTNFPKNDDIRDGVLLGLTQEVISWKDMVG